jgi:hypothetical protein
MEKTKKKSQQKIEGIFGIQWGSWNAAPCVSGEPMGALTFPPSWRKKHSSESRILRVIGWKCSH